MKDARIFLIFLKQNTIYFTKRALNSGFSGNVAVVLRAIEIKE